MGICVEHGPIQGPRFYWVGVVFPTLTAGSAGVSLGCGEIVKVALPKLPQFAGWLEGVFGPLGGLGVVPGLAAVQWIVLSCYSHKVAEGNG